MKKLVLFLSFIAIICNVWAVDPKTQINEAKEYYTKGDYQKAIDTYKAILNAGYMSVELYYNMGNAYYKAHDIKSAILFYEKARLLDPSDDDVNYNLELARSFTVDKIETMNDVFFVTWLKSLRNLLSAGKWATISIVLFFVALGTFLLYLLSGKLALRKTGFTVGIVAIIFATFSFVMGYQLRRAQTTSKTAIIFTPTVTVRSTPAESGNNLFVLHEGTKVDILSEMSDISKVEWCEVRIADGNKGWVKKQDLEKI